MSDYDVCIIGAGPAGLACLSAIKTHYSLDSLSDGQVHRAAKCLHRDSISEKRVCVVDPSPQWMQSWQDKFQALDIAFLRSPAMAHPDMFDKNALLAYATQHGRDKDELLESGCDDVKSLLPLGESQIGLWKLPSTKLFVDFCQDLSKQLSHDYIQGSVVDVSKGDDDDSSSSYGSNDQEDFFQVQLQDGTKIWAESVVLALGTTGRPIVPRSLAQAPRIFQWTELDRLANNSNYQSVLVVGGGLTAVQCAQRVLRQDKSRRCVLCSRRDLVERHFDLQVDWFDRRKTNKCMADFYHLPMDERLRLLQESRGGGSVPPIYLRDVRRLQRLGRLRVEVGDAAYLWDASMPPPPHMAVSIQGRIYQFDAIVLACGMEPDCSYNPLVRKLQERWPIDMIGGFPSISEDCKWTTDKLFVVGGLGSLNIGPDAANLMGIRRAAQIVANSLDCRCWMREADVLSNRFDAFLLLDDETDTSSDEEDDDDGDGEPLCIE